MATPFRNIIISTSPLLLFLWLLLNEFHCQMIKNDQPLTYRVAVFEHSVITAHKDADSRKMALQAMRKNIDIYNETVIKARLKGVKLLTFPEYGISGIRMTRQQMSLFAEIIPDPKSRPRNPCEDPEFKGQSTEIQRLLSCIARDNKMFLVVNIASRETCNNETGCPSDGRYLYNTNVVFSPKGEVVARYYKTHLFGEKWFNPAKSAEMAIFNTPFDRFATFICFDLLFEKPFIELVEKYNIRNIAFPTAWVELPPVSRSIQTHPAFARGANVNLLVANLHWLPSKSFGSGIYTPKGEAAYYYNPNASRSKLIVADLHKFSNVEPDVLGTHFGQSEETNTENNTAFDVFDTGIPFKYKHLKTKCGSVAICHKSFCCKASYAIKGPFREVYALGAYKGYLLVSKNKMYVQICMLLKCPSSNCGATITSAKTVFSRISLQGSGFSSKYVYPSVMAMNRGHYVLVQNAWTFSSRKGIQSRPGRAITLHSASLFGRVYSSDVLVKKDSTTQITDEKPDDRFN